MVFGCSGAGLCLCGFVLLAIVLFVCLLCVLFVVVWIVALCYLWRFVFGMCVCAILWVVGVLAKDWRLAVVFCFNCLVW